MAFVASLGYEFNDVTLSVDGGYAKTKFKDTDKKKLVSLYHQVPISNYWLK